jgi:hypothetical protein
VLILIFGGIGVGLCFGCCPRKKVSMMRMLLPNIEEFVEAKSRNPVRPKSLGLQTSLADIVVTLKWGDTEESKWALGKKLSVRLMMNLDARHATSAPSRSSRGGHGTDP